MQKTSSKTFNYVQVHLILKKKKKEHFFITLASHEEVS